MGQNGVDCCREFKGRQGVAAEHRIGGGYLYRPNELIVHGEDLGVAEKALEGRGACVTRQDAIEGTSQFLVEVDEHAPPVPELVQALRPCDEDSEGALRVSPNHVMVGFGHPLAFPAGPPRPAPPLAQLTGQDGSGVKVAILDTGVMHGHGWLGNRATPANNGDEEVPPGPGSQLGEYEGHGTFIAGVVLQQAPGASLHIQKAFSDAAGISDAEVASLLRSLPQDVDVVTLSFGAYSHGDQPLPAVTDAVRALLRRDRLPVVVAAAGNLNHDRPTWPAATKGVIAVAATDSSHTRASFSNFGPWVDAAALGVNVHSTFFAGPLSATSHAGHHVAPAQFEGYAFWDGTSFAAPWVAGRIAAAMTAPAPKSARHAAVDVLGTASVVRADIGAILTP